MKLRKYLLNEKEIILENLNASAMPQNASYAEFFS